MSESGKDTDNQCLLSGWQENTNLIKQDIVRIMPTIVSTHIDSTYPIDPNEFNNLVVKREEEQRLRFSIDRKRYEIKKLKSNE